VRPGSLERIEYYKQRAESGLPLFEDAPSGIPMLPGQRNVCEQKSKPKEPTEPKEPEKMNIDEAIEVLTADGAESKLEHRISQLEGELEKLKKLRRIYATPATKQSTGKLDESLEAKILKAVQGGPKTPKEIAQAIGVHYMSVGKTVAASKKLKKIGNTVAAVK
jgi:hypothetical protein